MDYLTYLDPETRKLIEKYANAVPGLAEALAKRALGFGEAAATAVTGIAGSVPAGLQGMAELMRSGNLDKAAEATRAIQEGLTYVPRTDEGQSYLQALGGGFEKAGRAVESLPRQVVRSGLELPQQKEAQLETIPDLSELSLKYLGPEMTAAGYTGLNFLDPAHLKLGMAAVIPTIPLGMSKPLIGEAFTSALDDLVKTSTQSKASGDQWLAYLKNKGIREAEMRERGVEGFLKSKGNQPVSKDELTGMLSGPVGGMQIYPRVKGRDAPSGFIERLDMDDHPYVDSRDAYFVPYLDHATGAMYNLYYDPAGGTSLHFEPDFDESGAALTTPEQFARTSRAAPVALYEGPNELSQSAVKKLIRQHRQSLLDPVKGDLVAEFEPQYGEYTLGASGRSTEGLTPWAENYREILYQVPTEATPESLAMTPEQEARLTELVEKGAERRMDWDKVRSSGLSRRQIQHLESLDMANSYDELTPEQQVEYDQALKDYGQTPQYHSVTMDWTRLTPEERLEYFDLGQRKIGDHPEQTILKDYTGGHWGSDVPNVVAHTRVVTRDFGPEEGSYLHAEEFQSDPHQKAWELRKDRIHELMRERKITREEAAQLVPEDYGYRTAEKERTYREAEHTRERLDFEYRTMSRDELEQRAVELGMMPHRVTDVDPDLSRADIEERISDAIEGSLEYIRTDPTLQKMIDELQTSKDIYQTLEDYIPDAEIDEIFKSIGNLDWDSRHAGPKLSWNEVRDKDPRAESDIFKRLDDLTNSSSTSGVRDMPFKENWHEVVFKHMVQRAAREGHNGLLWTGGVDQVNRWTDALRKQVDAIDHFRFPDGTLRVVARKGNQAVFTGEMKAGDTVLTTASDHRAQGVPLSDVFGTKIANQILKESPVPEKLETQLPPTTYKRIRLESDYETGDIHIFGQPVGDNVEELYFGSIEQGDDFQSRLSSRLPGRVAVLQGAVPQGFLPRRIYRQFRDDTDNGMGTVVWEEGETSYPAEIDESYFSRSHAEPAKEAIKTITGEDLTVGGAGMTNFYDEKLVQVANKLGKKYGVRVDKAYLKYPEEKVRGELESLTESIQATSDKLTRYRALKEDPEYSAKWTELSRKADEAHNAVEAQEKLLSETWSSLPARQRMEVGSRYRYIQEDPTYQALDGEATRLADEIREFGIDPDLIDSEIGDLEDNLTTLNSRLKKVQEKQQGHWVWRLRFTDQMKEALKKEPQKLYKRGGHVKGYAEGGLIESELLPTSVKDWVKPNVEQAKALYHGLLQLPYLAAGTLPDLMAAAMRPFGYNVEKPIGGSEWLVDKARQYQMLPEASMNAPAAETLGSVLASTLDPAAGAAKLAGAQSGS